MTGNKLVVVFLLVLSVLPVQVNAKPEHQIEFGGRARVAHLEDNTENGKAASLLVRGSWHAQWQLPLRTLVELDYVATAFKDDHSDGVRLNGKPIIPDVPGNEINRAFVEWRKRDWRTIVGRQALALDEQRFIGSVNFWQNEQSFDAAWLEGRAFRASKFQYAYLHNANRIFGDDAGQRLSSDDIVYGAESVERPARLLGDHRQNTHLFRAEINEFDYLSWVIFGLAVNNQDAPSANNDTLSTRLDWKYKPGKLAYSSKIELATQERKTSDFHAHFDYAMLELAAQVDSLSLALRYEMLEGNGEQSFITPLGSLHEFQGWADVFTTIPTTGLNDVSFAVVWRQTPWEIDARAHYFESEQGNINFGREFDIDLIYEPAEKHRWMLRSAFFESATSSDDALVLDDKVRLFLHYEYNL